MKRIAFFLCTLLLVGVVSTTVQAKYPMIEFFFVKFDGVDGLKRAEHAIQAAGFKLVTGTYQGEDRVGVSGDYTAAIGCSTEYPTAVVFIVSGPNYDEAHRLARKMQDYFINYKSK